MNCRCGLPARPDPVSDPRKHAQWRSLYGRAFNYLEPELSIRPHRMHAPVRLSEGEAGRPERNRVELGG